MNENEQTTPDKTLDPKRRSHDRQYWDDALKRYVDFATPAERLIDPASNAPNRAMRRKAMALARSPRNRRAEQNRGARVGR